MDYQKAIEYFDKELKRDCMVLSPMLEGKKSVRAQFFETAISAMEELEQYKQLGTLEEVRAAVEKQKRKKPKNVNTEGYRYTDTYRCPICSGNFSGTGIADYCYHCGQALDWSEED